MKTRTLITAALTAVALQLHAQTYVGGDISLLPSYEDNNVAYYDENGQKIDDVLKYLKSEAVGWNAQRVRLFVSPKGKAPNDQKTAVSKDDPQVCQSLDYVTRLGRRIKAEGFAFMLDFHYSDTWADPSNQWTPDEWLALDDAALQTKIYDYTKECLQQLVEAGAAPDFIQTGNEISYGMLWGKYSPNTNTNRCYSNSPAANWNRFLALLKQATKACREVCPQARIVIHSERSGDPSALDFYFRKLQDIDFDVVGLSYYPFWHQGLSKLSESLNKLASLCPTKKVQIVETAYYYQWQPKKGQGIDYDFSATWPVSPEGQSAYAKALIAELKKHPNVDGLYWWFPEENGNGPNSKVLKDWVNRGLWDDNTHRALPGLYVLKDFADGGTSGIDRVTTDRTAGSSQWHSLSGQRLDASPARPGIYIKGNKKMVVK